MIISIMALLVGPFVGTAVDRFGPRRIALFGVPFYCAMLATLSFAGSAIWTWWSLWILVALGAMAILPVVWISVLNGYFRASQGLAMAVALSGTGMGAAIYPMLINALVESFGWRMAYVVLAALCCLVTVPLVALFFREAPGAVRNTASLAGKSSARGQMASPRFIKMALAAIVFAVASCALTNNMVPVLIGEGLTPAKAAATAGLLGIGSVAGRLGGGYLLDRLDANKVAAASVLLPIVPTMILLATDGSQAWSAVACLVMGLSVGAELDCCAYLAARHFGTRNFGALFGTINGILLFGAGLAPLAANAVFDATRSYDLVLYGLLPLFVATAVLFLWLGSYSHLDRETGEPLPALA